MEINKKGIILINLGSPNSPSVPNVRIYLKEFLMDKRVIDIPYLYRFALVKGVIVPFRAPKSAHAYKCIWTDKGSPLITISNDFKIDLQSKLPFPITVCMRYGNPTPPEAFNELINKQPDIEELMIAPMYPHYAMSSYETALEYVREKILALRKDIKIKVLKPFYSEPAYISSLSNRIREFSGGKNFDAYLFSYHGLPVRHLKKSDPTKEHCYSTNDCCEIKSAAWDLCYKHQVKVTTKLVAEELRLDSSKVLFSFQSRLGSDKWIQPYTDLMFKELPSKGIKKLLVVCPSFVTDCLETLEEIQIRGRESFLESGGEEFVAVPCLNTLPEWVDTFASYCTGRNDKYSHLWG